MAQNDLYPELERRLLKRKNELLGQGRETQVQLNQHVLDSPGDVGDVAVVDVDTDFILQMADNHRSELSSIQDALTKLHRGEYGLCENCKNEIARQRLLHLPAAKLCVDCQQANERFENVSHTNPRPKL